MFKWIMPLPQNTHALPRPICPVLPPPLTQHGGHVGVDHAAALAHAAHRHHRAAAERHAQRSLLGHQVCAGGVGRGGVGWWGGVGWRAGEWRCKAGPVSQGQRRSYGVMDSFMACHFDTSKLVMPATPISPTRTRPHTHTAPSTSLYQSLHPPSPRPPLGTHAPVVVMATAARCASAVLAPRLAGSCGMAGRKDSIFMRRPITPAGGGVGWGGGQRRGGGAQEQTCGCAAACAGRLPPCAPPPGRRGHTAALTSHRSAVSRRGVASPLAPPNCSRAPGAP